MDTHTHHLLHMFPHFYTGHLWCISILFRSMKRLFTTFLVYLDELINRFYLNNQVHHILAYKYIGHFDRYHGLSSGYFQCSEMLWTRWEKKKPLLILSFGILYIWIVVYLDTKSDFQKQFPCRKKTLHIWNTKKEQIVLTWAIAVTPARVTITYSLIRFSTFTMIWAWGIVSASWKKMNQNGDMEALKVVLKTHEVHFFQASSSWLD